MNTEFTCAVPQNPSGKSSNLIGVLATSCYHYRSAAKWTVHKAHLLNVVWPCIAMMTEAEACTLTWSMDMCGQGEISSGLPGNRQLEEWRLCRREAELVYRRDLTRTECIERVGWEASR